MASALNQRPAQVRGSATQVSVDAHDDGLYYEDNVGTWVEDKHRLVALYQKFFSTGMKRKWAKRVYIDLFSGPGMVRLRGRERFLWSSPLLALHVADPFDKCIFCERDDKALDALRQKS
jgi:three-Cys-motif partner protein